MQMVTIPIRVLGYAAYAGSLVGSDSRVEPGWEVGDRVEEGSGLAVGEVRLIKDTGAEQDAGRTKPHGRLDVVAVAVADHHYPSGVEPELVIARLEEWPRRLA